VADYVLILTDQPPADTIKDDELALSRQVPPETPYYLPDLDGVEVSRVSRGIQLRVQEQLLFATAEAELSGEGERLVGHLVEMIQRHSGEVSVEGHTDDRPIQTSQFPSNWALSSARAIAIVHSLEASGVSSSRLRAVGLADTRPLVNDDSAAGRARNRRVEVVIHVE
jgi:chemotaxis protein MotB